MKDVTTVGGRRATDHRTDADLAVLLAKEIGEEVRPAMFYLDGRLYSTCGRCGRHFVVQKDYRENCEACR